MIVALAWLQAEVCDHNCIIWPVILLCLSPVLTFFILDRNTDDHVAPAQ